MKFETLQIHAGYASTTAPRQAVSFYKKQHGRSPKETNVTIEACLL
jgi:hypothetical protein